MLKKYLQRKIKFDKRYIYYLIFLLWVIATVFIIRTLMLPLHITESKNNNNIYQDTTFQYQADVIPYALHPKGGLVDINNPIFRKITKDIKFHIKSIIKSDEPIKVSGNKKIIIKITADQLWEKEFTISPEESFSYEGNNNVIYDDSYSLNLSELTNFIAEMEKDTEFNPGSYNFEVTPLIDGSIYYNGNIYPLEMNSKTYVKYSNSLITIGDENSFSNTNNLMTSVLIPQYYHLFSISMPLKMAKNVFILLYLPFTILIVFRCYRILQLRPKKSEQECIEKKYRTRFIPISDVIHTTMYEMISLDSIKSLIKLSDEKDALILKYISNDRMAADYYLIDGKYLYVYQINSKVKENVFESISNEEGSVIA